MKNVITEWTNRDPKKALTAQERETMLGESAFTPACDFVLGMAEYVFALTVQTPHHLLQWQMIACITPIERG